MLTAFKAIDLRDPTLQFTAIHENAFATCTFGLGLHKFDKPEKLAKIVNTFGGDPQEFGFN